MGMSKTDFKKLIQKQKPNASERVIDEEINNTGKQDGFDESDRKKVIEEIDKRWSGVLKKKISRPVP